MKDEIKTQSLEEFVSELAKMNSILVEANEVGQCVSIFTENVPYHAEWIKGEGGDISLYRAMDDNRIIGAHLPLRNFSGRIVTATISKP